MIVYILCALATPLRLTLQALGWLLARLEPALPYSPHRAAFDPDSGRCLYCETHEIDDALAMRSFGDVNRQPRNVPARNGANVA